MKYLFSFLFFFITSLSSSANQYIVGLTVGRFPSSQPSVVSYSFPPAQQIVAAPYPYYSAPALDRCATVCCNCYYPKSNPYRQIRTQEIIEPVMGY